MKPESGAATRLSIIGGGRLGCSLARWLQARSELVIQDVLTRSLVSAQKAVATVGSGCAIESVDQLRPTDIVMLAVPDSSIPDTVEQMSRSALDLQNTTVFHTSGMFGAEVLSPLAARTAGVAAVHPLRAFNRADTGPGALDEMLCLASGDDAALELLKPLFSKARWREVGDIARNQYHTGAVLLSNYSRALALAGESVLVHAGLDHALAREIRDSLLNNAVADMKNREAMAGLTGPLQRGDTPAVIRQVDTLELLPEIQQLYLQLARLTLEQLVAESRLPAAASIELERKLKDGLHNS